MTTKDEPISPRLRQVVKTAIDASTVDEFWEDVAVTGTPLIEYTDDPRRNLVTFLWRDEVDVGDVAVFSALDRGEPEHAMMMRLDGTDIWYRTYEVNDDLDITYRLSPLSEKAPTDRMAFFSTRGRNAHPDPLNPRVHALKSNNPGRTFSLATLKGARSRDWDPTAPVRGEVVEHKVTSAVLGNERNVWVYTPSEDPGPDATHDLIIFLDGWHYLEWVHAATIVEHLVSGEEMDPPVIVFVDCLDMEIRSREQRCHDSFNTFLIEELMPWIRATCPTTTDEASRTTIGGSSNGGLAAAYAGLKHANVFGNILSQSGTFAWHPEEEKGLDAPREWLTHQFAISDHQPLRLHLATGKLENNIRPGRPPGGLLANRHMRDVLLAKGYEVDFLEFNGGHGYYEWSGVLGDGLAALARMREAARASG